MKKVLQILICFSLIFLSIPCDESSNKESDQSESQNEGEKKDYVLIDVRSVDEFKSGEAKGAINIPHTEISEKIESITKEKSQKIYVYCVSGRRAGIAKAALEEKGYKNVVNLKTLAEAKELTKE